MALLGRFFHFFAGLDLQNVHTEFAAFHALE